MKAQQEEKLATMDEAMAGFRRRLLGLEGQHDDRTTEKGQLALDYAVRLVLDYSLH